MKKSIVLFALAFSSFFFAKGNFKTEPEPPLKYPEELPAFKFAH